MPTSPFPTLNGSKHSRTSHIKQVVALTIGLVWLCAFAAVQAVHAESPPTGTLSVVPADGRPRGIQIRSQTVDATVRQASDGVWADTVLWVKLYNPGKQPIVVPVALGGPQLGPRALPEIRDISLDNRPVELAGLQPLNSKPDGAVVGFTLPITVPLKGSAVMRIRYTQALPEQNGLVTFTYPMTATTRWSGTPESLRLTIKFTPPIQTEEMLSHAPAAQRYERDGLTWHWDGQRPQANIGVAFMAPAWWAQLVAARAAAAAPDAGLAEHLALSRLYQQLADLPPPGFESTADFSERHFPAELAELQAAVAAPGQGASQERAAIYLRMAELYLAHADRLGAGPGDAYRQMAAATLESAVALDDTDSSLRETTGKLYALLAEAAQARGDRTTAELHLARIAALRGPTGIASPQALTQAAALVRATEAAEHGNLDAARRLVADALGADAVTLPGAPPPRATQAVVTVTAAFNERVFSLRLGGGAPTVIAALLADTAAALSAQPEAQVVTAGDQITISIPCSDSSSAVVTQTRLIAALPQEPELALLAAAMSPRRLVWETRSGVIDTTKRYVEHSDLGPAWQVWVQRAKPLEEASREDNPTPAHGERLTRLQQAFWAADAATWRKLAAGSWVEYRVEMPGAETRRHWEAPAGAARLLEVETSQVNPKQVAWIAGSVAVLLVLLALAAWRML